MTDPDKTLEELKAELDAASDVANTAAKDTYYYDDYDA